MLPRLIGDVFDFANVSGGLANEVKVACYMLELYQVRPLDSELRSEGFARMHHPSLLSNSPLC